MTCNNRELVCTITCEKWAKKHSFFYVSTTKILFAYGLWILYKLRFNIIQTFRRTKSPFKRIDKSAMCAKLYIALQFFVYNQLHWKIYCTIFAENTSSNELHTETFICLQSYSIYITSNIVSIENSISIISRLLENVITLNNIVFAFITIDFGSFAL